MASSNAHLRSVRTPSTTEKTAFLLKQTLDGHHFDRKGKKLTSADLLENTFRYQRNAKIWSILANAAALVSVSSALLGLTKRARRWL